nr:hypothetical protein [Streptomyces roseoverticillatus]
MLPGLSRELAAHGAPLVDFCRDSRFQLPHRVLSVMESGILIQPVSRPLLEAAVRHRVLGLGNVVLREERTATGLLTDGAGRRVTGVRLTRRARRPREAAEETLTADLVADASGRSSHLPDWLLSHGLPRVAETRIDARVGYATRSYRTTPDAPAPWRALFETPQAPHSPRGAFALRIEDNRLLVTLHGAGGDHPPVGEQGFDTFMKSLSSDLYDTVRQLRPDSPIRRYARTANRRLHYHRLTPWPQQLIVLGDAACTFNPVYAQGMTVAALEALALRDLLAQRTGPPPPDLARRFQRRLAHLTTWPWLLATVSDHAWQTNRSPSLLTPLYRASQWYMDQWLRGATQDPGMLYDLARVTNMLAGPAPLFHPRHIIRIGQGALTPRHGTARSTGTAEAHAGQPSCRGAPGGHATETTEGADRPEREGRTGR